MRGRLVEALPAGGEVTGGAGSIGQADKALTVTQSSQRLSIDWQVFDIGADESVAIVQPGADAPAFNRVLGTDPSEIAGPLTANGRIFLLNPNGLLFTQIAQVNVGGLIASSLSPLDELDAGGGADFAAIGAVTGLTGVLSGDDVRVRPHPSGRRQLRLGGAARAQRRDPPAGRAELVPLGALVHPTHVELHLRRAAASVR